MWFRCQRERLKEATNVNSKLVAIAAVILIASITAYQYFRSPIEPSGTITVSGAWALYPMMVKWAEEFQKITPNVRIEVSAGGAGKGMVDALAELVDIGMVSREIYPAEIDKGAFWVSVVKDAVVLTVNKDNLILRDILAKGVKRSTFIDVYIHGNITNWGQVVGRPEITDEIHVYTRSDSCGAAETWAKYLGHRQEDLKGVGVYGDPGLAEAVKSDRLGVGFNNINYAYDAETGIPIEGLVIVPLDLNENTQVDENEDFYGNRDKIIKAITTGAYPSPPARELNLVTKGKFTGVTMKFVKWILTEGQKYALETGYVPLSNERCAEELKKLEG